MPFACNKSFSPFTVIFSTFFLLLRLSQSTLYFHYSKIEAGKKSLNWPFVYPFRFECITILLIRFGFSMQIDPIKKHFIGISLQTWNVTWLLFYHYQYDATMAWWMRLIDQTVFFAPTERETGPENNKLCWELLAKDKRMFGHLYIGRNRTGWSRLIHRNFTDFILFQANWIENCI